MKLYKFVSVTKEKIAMDYYWKFKVYFRFRLRCE